MIQFSHGGKILRHGRWTRFYHVTRGHQSIFTRSVKAVFSIVQEGIATDALTNALTLMADSLNKMNARRKLMWESSRWKHYNDFRVFIMGIKGNDDIFPNGLLYEGVWDEPKACRGQTGAQDNIIPTADIASGVIHYYPNNQLTHYLMDLRQYRTKCVQAFFKELAQQMQKTLW